jgi:hypothetical protein
VRAIIPALAAAALAIVLAGCGSASDQGPRPQDVNPARLVSILPTPAGLRLAPPGRPAGAAAIQAALAGHPDAGAASRFGDLGLQRGSVRRWSGPGGARLVAVVSVWDDHFAATSVGGNSAEIPLGTPGAHAWTPVQIGGSRGSEVGPPGPPSRALSYAVGPTSLFVRSEGPVSEATVVRTMQRLMSALGAGPPIG